MTTSIQNSQVPQFRTDSHYRIEHVLDPDGDGQVFLTLDTQLDQWVVLKVLKDPLADAADTGLQFKQAVKLRSALKGEHIAEVLDSGTSLEGYPFYVMEHLPGESLKQCLQRDRRLSIQRSVNIASQICVALEESCQSRFEILFDSEDPFVVLPHELKPSQIILMPGEQVKLLDCGLTQTVRNSCCDTQSDDYEPALSQTFHYVAPEQLDGEDNNHLADIYVLGILLYEMVSGTDPFGLGLNSQRVREGAWMYAHALKEPRSLQLLLEKSSASVALSEIVHRCLAKKPCDRYPSVDALRQALESLKVCEDLVSDVASDHHITQLQPESSSLVDKEQEHIQDIPATQASSSLIEIEDSHDQTCLQGDLETGLQDKPTKVDSKPIFSVLQENTEDAKPHVRISPSGEILDGVTPSRCDLLPFNRLSADRPVDEGHFPHVSAASRWADDQERAMPDSERDDTRIQTPAGYAPNDHQVTQVRLPSAWSEIDATLSDDQAVAQERVVYETIVQSSEFEASPTLDQTVVQMHSGRNGRENQPRGKDSIEVENAPDIGVDETIVQYSNASVQSPVAQQDACVQDHRGEATIVQPSSPNSSHSGDQTIAQPIEEANVVDIRKEGDLDSGTVADETIVQYLDSAIHNPAEQTVAQSIALMDEYPLDQTVCQQNMPYVEPTDMASEHSKSQGQSGAIVRTVWRSRRSFTTLFRNFGGRCFSSLRRVLNFRPGRSRPQLPASVSRPPSFGQGRHSENNASQNAEPDNFPQQELDRCRVDLAKELARNGKFRDAIATLKKIQESSSSYPKAQKLLHSWQSL